MGGLDRAVVARAVGVVLLVLVPPVVLVRTILGPDSDSPLWNVIVLAFLVSFVVGGIVAAARSAEAPLKHAAATGAVAFGLALLAGLVRNLLTGWSLGFAGIVTALLLWQIAVSLSMLGGVLGRRRRRTEAQQA